ncbi:MAG: pyrroline-5-carboxylate reductase [Lachnospiraceae bacterium]|nr:pyrroline-5-carboxylate reductase [Lachnospiraceae bacterium]
MKLGLIGAGNMARAIIGGVVKQGSYKGEDLLVSRRQQEALEKLREAYGCGITTDNVRVAAETDILFLAVKPQMLPGVIAEIKDVVRQEQVIVSIAAGKTLDWLTEAFGRNVKLVRCMPNTPALAGEGCTAVCANALTSEEELERITQIFESCGRAVRLPESLMDAFGALAGSSPAYVFMLIEAMADGAVAGGIPRAQAYGIAAQTVLGSARLLLETGEHPGVLKDMVCSPGGTTIRGLQILEREGMRAAVMQALEACIQRSKEL